MAAKMDRPTAMLQDAGKAIDQAQQSNSDTVPDMADQSINEADDSSRPGATSNEHNRRKRKFGNERIQQGGKGYKDHRRGGARGQRGNMGRTEYFRDGSDKRQKVDDTRNKASNSTQPSAFGQTFTAEEIAAEERRPKRKVAVMIGYAGTGYKGLQIAPIEKTIEGDMFTALVKAGAISKANADDPKKASLVRCARTDKGVHAAGNMISLKLIVEEADIVEKINNELPEQIRVWGIERTTGSFSCYQACDSRWYEYLIPTHAFLPPHPSSWTAKELERLAEEAGDLEGYRSRQQEVHGFWEKIDAKEIQPILDAVDDDIRDDVANAVRGNLAESEGPVCDVDVKNEDVCVADEETALEFSASIAGERDGVEDEKTEETAISVTESAVTIEAGKEGGEERLLRDQQSLPNAQASTTPSDVVSSAQIDRKRRLTAATRQLRDAYNDAKRRYRIPGKRVDRIQAALDLFVGTKSYHNYTIQKSYRDPSAKRNIMSFVVHPTPILIGEGGGSEKSEWLSLKIHGQSFMMHQIRKMVGMTALVVRSGCHVARIQDSFGEVKYSIPKVPALGLLLERPVFKTYNTNVALKNERAPLDFGKYEAAIEEFKRKQIYERIFREEAEGNVFHQFFNHIDNYREPWFLYVSSIGIEATMGGSGYGETEEGQDGRV